MNEFLASTAYEQLRKIAVSENSPILYAMLQSYNHHHERWATPEDFLVDTVMALTSALSGTQAQLVEALSYTPPTRLCAKCGQYPQHWK
jgi:hypothetical protein